jgi:hypothetical protein
MASIAKTIEPKSDQLNTDDLIAGPMTIKITAVKVNDKSDQPVLIHYEGDNGKPYKPCKSMRRALILGWESSEGDDYVGKSVTLFCDPKVKWAGSEVGGIRISHMSHIADKKRFMLTETRGRRVPYEIAPLKTTPKAKLSDEVYNSLCKEMDEACDMDTLSIVGEKIKSGDYEDAGTAKLKSHYKESMKRVRGLGE